MILRRKPWVLSLVLGVAALGVVVGGMTSPAPTPPVRAPSVVHPPPTEPSIRVKDAYLNTTYVAPRNAAARRGSAGTIDIPALGIAAQVAVTHLDHGVMAVPNNVNEVGWLAGSAEPSSLVGSSVVAGHVSDPRDAPGALAPLSRARRGQSVIWRDVDGLSHRFVIVKIARYPRATGLPPSLFTTTGPHVLTLVTCANRKVSANGRFHYADNLVVTARASPEM